MLAARVGLGTLAVESAEFIVARSVFACPVVLPLDGGHHSAAAAMAKTPRARLPEGPSLDALEVLTPPNPEYRNVVSAIDVPTLLVMGDSP